MRGNSKGRYTFLMLAGVYLLYLGWKLLSGFISGETTNPVFLISSILFFIVGVLIIISNIRQIMKISDEETKANAENTNAKNGDVESTDDESADVNKPAAGADTSTFAGKESKQDSSQKKTGPSLFDRAGLGAATDEKTDDE